jgi:riboflavin synthase
MFTGLIQAVGQVVALDPIGSGVSDLRMRVSSGALPLAGVGLGESISVSGVCLTVTSLDDVSFTADVSPETLRVTAGFVVGQAVNLETSLTLASKLGGHLVTGHVDGVGTVKRIENLGGSHLLEVAVPVPLLRYVARKGSITIDGVSLTVNAVEGDRLQANLIPHTLAVTTLQRLAVGSAVNLEVDLVARYVERMLSFHR